MSRVNRAARVALLCCGVAARTLVAQSIAAPPVDSIAKLNRAGLWEQASTLARQGLGSTATPDDKCAYRIGRVYALTRLGVYASASNELKTIDAQCARSSAARQQAADVASIRRELAMPPLPRTGMDFSAIDQFWKVADKLAQDRTPSDADWRALFMTPGYRLATMSVPTVRTDMEIALRPSRHTEFDSVSKTSGDQASRLKHLAAAYAHRAELARLRDSLTRSLPVQEAITRAAKFLPPHATEAIDPPFVAFALFRNDAYSLGEQGVIVDLYHVLYQPLTPTLAHEFHHSYLAAVNRMQPPAGDSPDGPLVWALLGMRNEGIADLVDKPYPLAYTSTPEMMAYAKRYNEAYARTPAVLHSIDSLLVIAADDSSQIRSVGQNVATLLPSNGHYNGSYVAREVYETFDVDSLYPGVYSPFALLRTYAAAEAKRGNRPPFSPKAVALLNSLESKYLRADVRP